MSEEVLKAPFLSGPLTPGTVSASSETSIPDTSSKQAGATQQQIANGAA